MTFTVVRPFYVVGGDGKVCGRDESLPYKSTAKRSTAVSRGPGMPGPYKWAEVYPCGGSLRRNSETFLCYFLLVTKESRTSRETAVNLTAAPAKLPAAAG